MSIRINKVLRELNVGIATAVEFLQKKGFSVEKDTNAKISDEEYELLAKEFDKDYALKLEAAKMSQERHQKEKKESVAVEGYEKKQLEEIKTEVPKENKLKVHILGKLDLANLNKKPAPKVPVEEEKIEEKPVVVVEPVVEPEPETLPQVEIETPKEVEIQVVEPIQSEIDDSIEDEEDDDEARENETDENSEEEESKPEEKAALTEPEATTAPSEEVFRYSKTPTIERPKVLGSIDLASMNLSTRPKKKTKEARKRERAEKERQQAVAAQQKKAAAAAATQKPQTNANAQNANAQNANAKKSDIHSEKREKRKRIDKERIDITSGNTIAAVKNNNNNNQNRPNNQSLKLRKPATAKNKINEEDVQKQVKETLAQLTNKGKKKTADYKKLKKQNASQRQSAQWAADEQGNKLIKITEFVTANDLANMMNVPVVQVISTCMAIGMMVSINQRLDAETINIVAEEFGFKTEYVSAEVVEAITEEEDNPDDLQARPPIVTVMGHVDHGKTSLLDNIRNTNVIAGEAGGITQHIGAYNVELADGRKITFLDTPGHEAFTAMRARGASVTDIAIIIVDSDDNRMPQTVEAINNASAANVPMVFAINKIDKPGANPEKIKEALAGMNYLVEDWGGKYQSQDISAKQGIGVPELLEKIVLEAELLDLKANPKRRAVGSVIESSLDKGRGYVVTMLIQNGTLKMGDIVLAGTHFGRVKAMFNERNQRITEAGPAEPVLILGLDGAPTAGDTIHVMETEQEAREIATKREQLQREQGLRTQKRITLTDIGRRLAIGNFQELNVIVKGDVDGSVEALSDSLIRLSTEQIQVNVIHKGVGQISESDVILAAASDAIIVGFQVRPSQSARKLAEKEGVDIRLYSIIYDAIEEVKAAMEGMLSPTIKEEITANVEIREVFKITKVGTVAGCMVKEGKIKRGNKIRLIRDGIVIYTGEHGSLKRFKDDVKEVSQGYECGLNIQNFNDIKIGDIVEAFEEIEVKQTL
ncbi:MAG: translation initiation factor IF-2 [Candidatus Symbiothrix sp.]|jgi:translation initiation factor IF-2|nr:translation initiation factor IF-2 [Candidatus Symbiothrix sp.]